jgi:hypothetical protein
MFVREHTGVLSARHAVCLYVYKKDYCNLWYGCTCMCVFVYVCSNFDVVSGSLLCVYICMYTCTYIHTHTCIYVWSLVVCSVCCACVYVVLGSVQCTFMCVYIYIYI